MFKFELYEDIFSSSNVYLTLLQNINSNNKLKQKETKQRSKIKRNKTHKQMDTYHSPVYLFISKPPDKKINDDTV